MKCIKPFPKPMYITQPLLPDVDDVRDMISQIWENKYLTNNGRMSVQLEKELMRYLRVNYLSLFNNGTIALQTALKLLRLSGEVITTPFTFAATAHAISMNNISPVFCDIEEDTFNIDPSRIEDLITPKTTAILPVHVYGNPCRVDDIDMIAKRHGLKVIYDAAHAFGVQLNGKPIGSFGDISMFSFHATKIFHTLEGGALVFNNPYLKERADCLKNFGIRSEDFVAEPGTNGKLNEVQAAIGILVLRLVNEEIKRRREITCLYRELLKDMCGIATTKDIEGVTHNYPYFIIRITEEEFGISRDDLYSRLKEYNVFSRKYFYPLCSKYPCYKNLPSASASNLPAAEKTAERVLALPLHGRLSAEDVETICSIIKEIRNG